MRESICVDAVGNIRCGGRALHRRARGDMSLGGDTQRRQTLRNTLRMAGESMEATERGKKNEGGNS